MNMQDLLNGLVMGKRQESGPMTVIPLLGESEETKNHASFEEISFDGTVEYGVMRFANKSEKPFIVPAGYAVITRQSAQDHGSPYSFLLEPEEISYNGRTCCIEETQPGMINGSKVKDFYLLPLDVRKNVFLKDKRHIGETKRFEGDHDFSRLWPLISRFQSKLVKEGDAHLVYFFNKYMDQLNRFNAEFEVVKGQRGAIILIHGKIVGIEIAPTHDYWKVLWKRLIRDCYGSEIVRLAFENPVKGFEDGQKDAIDLGECMTIEEIQRELRTHEERQTEQVATAVRDTLSVPFTWNKADRNLPSKSSGGFVYHIGRAEGAQEVFAEVYTEGDYVVYASVLL